MNVIARFEIEFVQFLDHLGGVIQSLPAFACDPQVLISLYRSMVFTRAFDAKAVALQRTGQIGTFASSLGQEAVSIGAASAMRPEDVLVPSYRDFGGQILRGVTIEELLLYWGGDERGNDFSGPRQDFPISVPVASQAAHAAGAANAFKYRRDPRVAVCLLGDGGTSKGDFYEAINVAGAWALPAVFVIINNQWAISVPRSIQTAAKTLAQKAIAAGIEGVQVDGNDIIAVRFVVERALQKARSGSGPTVIEAVTYRLGDHTTADDSTRYRDAEEIKKQWMYEPLTRLRNYLLGCGAWNMGAEEVLRDDCATHVQKAVANYLALPQPQPEAMFDHLYAVLPKSIEGQRATAVAESRRHG